MGKILFLSLKIKLEFSIFLGKIFFQKRYSPPSVEGKRGLYIPGYRHRGTEEGIFFKNVLCFKIYSLSLYPKWKQKKT